MMATGATVPGLYSHIAHLVDKEEGEIPQPFKGAKPKQTRGTGKPKGKPHEQRQNPPKTQEADETYTYETLTIIITTITIMPQVRVKAADLFSGQSGNRQFRGFTQRNRGQRPQYSQCQFQNYQYQRGTSQQNRTQYGNNRKPYFQGNQVNSYRGQSHDHGPPHFRGCSHGRANYQNSNGAYQYQYYMHGPQPEQYGPPCSLCGSFNHSPKHCYKGEHDINNIMEKMSVNPHQSQQGNLYQ